MSLEEYGSEGLCNYVDTKQGSELGLNHYCF